MNDNLQTQAEAPSGKYAVGIRYGLMIGFISIFLNTVNFLYVVKWNFMAFGFFGILTFAVAVIFYCVAVAQQRKLMGGYINIKEAFQTVFVAILISQIMSTIYGLVYAKYIDPECLVRMKESAIAFFEKIKMPQDQLDEQIKKIDQKLDGSMNPGKLLYSFAQAIIIQSILGLICALIMKKDKPATQ